MMEEKTINQKIGARIQTLRKERKITQESLAETVNISTKFLSIIECGKSFPKTDKLVSIAKALNCSADDIFCDVIPKSYPVKISKLGQMIESLPQSEQEKIFAMLETYISKCR